LTSTFTDLLPVFRTVASITFAVCLVFGLALGFPRALWSAWRQRARRRREERLLLRVLAEKASLVEPSRR
jgi:hypothetical protein